MKELEGIIAEVKAALAAKQLEISQSATQISYVLEAFKNRQMEVLSFIQSTRQVSKDPAQKNTIVSNYQKDALELIGAISKILV
jgi:uncharacterized coiled-coil protein SlyX